MTIPLTGTGGLFTRLGTLGSLLNSINSQRGSTIPANVSSINSQYTSTNQDIIDSLYSSLLSYQNSCSSFNSAIKSMASNTVVEMAGDSVFLPNSNISTSLQILIGQMKVTGQTVNQCTLSSSWAAQSGNVGNPNVLISLNDFNNLLVEDCFSEPATAVVTVDSQSNPNLAGIETISIRSQFSVSDTFSWLYPAGSGTSRTVNAVSGMTNNGGGTSNWLNNGSFETWTANVPNSWNIGTGTAGTTIFQSSVHYDGSSSLQFLGNGSENTALFQQFSTPSVVGNTLSQIGTNSIFAVNLWVMVSGTPSAGVARIALSNGTSPINDNSNTPNSFNINLTSLTNIWVPFGGFFRTPNLNPSVINLEIKLTTPITSGFSVYFDRVAFCVPSQWYRGGPMTAFFSGNQNLIQNDSFNLQINNNYGGKFQGFFDKSFGMKSLGLLLPSSTSPTIPDF